RGRARAALHERLEPKPPPRRRGRDRTRTEHLGTHGRRAESPFGGGRRMPVPTGPFRECAGGPTRRYPRDLPSVRRNRARRRRRIVSAGISADKEHTMRIVIVGDVLLDRDISGTSTRLSPDGPAPVVDLHHIRHRPVGAALVATLLARNSAPAPERRRLHLTLVWSSCWPAMLCPPASVLGKCAPHLRCGRASIAGNDPTPRSVPASRADRRRRGLASRSASNTRNAHRDQRVGRAP